MAGEQTTSETPAVWAAVANIDKICLGGPNCGPERSGTKHFRGGAKVYVIDNLYGGRITVIGQHRKSRRYICVVMPARHLENLRPRAVYSPAVIRVAIKRFGSSRPLPTKEGAGDLCDAVQHWSKPRAAAAAQIQQPRPFVFARLIASLVAFIQRRITN